MMHRLILLAMMIGATALLPGCNHLREPALVLEAPAQPAPTPWLPDYAARISRLDAGSLKQRLQEARQNFAAEPGLENQCRYALLLGQWGHPDYAPNEAAALLVEAGEKMTAPQWTSVDARFAEFQAAQLKYLGARTSLLHGSRKENALLRSRLADAEAKLRAIADIEEELEEGLTTE